MVSFGRGFAQAKRAFVESKEEGHKVIDGGKRLANRILGENDTTETYDVSQAHVSQGGQCPHQYPSNNTYTGPQGYGSTNPLPLGHPHQHQQWSYDPNYLQNQPYHYHVGFSHYDPSPQHPPQDPPRLPTQYPPQQPQSDPSVTPSSGVPPQGVPSLGAAAFTQHGLSSELSYGQGGVSADSYGRYPDQNQVSYADAYHALNIGAQPDQNQGYGAPNVTSAADSHGFRQSNHQSAVTSGPHVPLGSLEPGKDEDMHKSRKKDDAHDSLGKEPGEAKSY